MANNYTQSSSQLAIQIDERYQTETIIAALADEYVSRAVDYLPFISAEGGYQFIAGPEVDADEIMRKFVFVGQDGAPADEHTIRQILQEEGPWFLDIERSAEAIDWSNPEQVANVRRIAEEYQQKWQEEADAYDEAFGLEEEKQNNN